MCRIRNFSEKEQSSGFLIYSAYLEHSVVKRNPRNVLLFIKVNVTFKSLRMLHW